MNLPPWLGEASLTLAVAVVILLIVKTLGWRKEKETMKAQILAPAESPPVRAPCLSSPIVQGLVSNQAVMLETNKRLEAILHQLSDNSLKQTLILESMAKTQESFVRAQGTQSRILARMCTKLRLESDEQIEGIG